MTGLVFLFELYKSEAITLSPFAAVFVRALMPTAKSAEKSFITLLLTNSPIAKDAYRFGSERLVRKNKISLLRPY